MSEKKIRTIFSIEPSLKKKAKELCEKRGISFSALIQELIRDWVIGSKTIREEVEELKKCVEVLENKK